ncbi:MAG: carboxypeptidase [Saprospiraceae bacterium]|nr:carboxypeptidase [Saprospiraceae bacterium]
MCLFLQMALAQDGNQEQSYAMPAVEQTFHSERSLIIGNERIDLDVEAGTMKLRSETNEPIALFGFTYYAKRNEPDKKNRPIVFAFNGGPGSSSFWLHMGVLGPTRIVVDDPGNTPAAPYILEDNAYSILDVADLVMMDPVGTGLSIPIGKATFKDFWGVDQDIRSLSLFITQFLIREGRMNSPKYLLGESYGTFRNAGLMNYMLNQGIAMNGVIMVAAVFDLRTLLFPPNDDLPYLVHFPTYAATAWYHNKIDNKTEDLFDFLDEIRVFTENEYMPALYRGDQLSQAEKSAMAQKLSHYTGLSQEYWMQSDLRVTNSEFFQELMRDQGETVGRLDSLFTVINQDLLSQTASYDPQSIAISPAYITGFMDYFFGQLGVAKDLTYMVTAGRRDGFAWDWKHKGNMAWGTIGAINTGIDMAEALTKDPNMKVLVLNGIYDLATVFYGVEYSINHLGLPPDIKKNIIMEYYEAGHMMYTHQPSLEKFKKDVADFILMTSK